MPISQGSHNWRSDEQTAIVHLCSRRRSKYVSVLEFCLFCVTEKFEILQVSRKWWVGGRLLVAQKGTDSRSQNGEFTLILRTSMLALFTALYDSFLEEEVWRGTDWMEKFPVCCWSTKHPEPLCCAWNSGSPV